MQRQSSIIDINQKMTSRSLAPPPLLLSTTCEYCVRADQSKKGEKNKIKPSQAPHSNSFSNMRSLWTSSWNGKTWGHLSVPRWMWTFPVVEKQMGCSWLQSSHSTSRLSETYIWLVQGKRKEASKWSKISDHIVHTSKNVHWCIFFIYNLKHAHSTSCESHGRRLTMGFETIRY